MGGGGALRHVIHKRVHLERHQPDDRKRLGYLEKHKDYVKRAKDFHRKENVIKKLHRKAFFKNEDEFAFGMISHRRNKEGQVVGKTKHLSNEELKLVTSQDSRYVGMREVIDRKAVEKRAASLQFLDAERPNRHTLFVDADDAEAAPAGAGAAGAAAAAAAAGGAAGRRRLEDVDVAERLDTHPALLGRKANRLRRGQLGARALAEPAEYQREAEAAYEELLQRQERCRSLRKVREELELRNHLRRKGRRVKVSDAKDGNPAVYRWMPERKP